MSSGFSQHLPTRTCIRSCKDLSTDFTRIFTTPFLKDLYRTLDQTFTHSAPLRLHREILARSSQNSQSLFREVYSVLRLSRKMSARHPKCCTCQTESSSCQKIQCEDSSQNTIVDPSSSNTARTTKITSKTICYLDPRLPKCQHGSGSATLAMRMKKCPISCVCQAKPCSRLQNVSNVPHLPQKIDMT